MLDESGMNEGWGGGSTVMAASTAAPGGEWLGFLGGMNLWVGEGLGLKIPVELELEIWV